MGWALGLALGGGCAVGIEDIGLDPSPATFGPPAGSGGDSEDTDGEPGDTEGAGSGGLDESGDSGQSDDTEGDAGDTEGESGDPPGDAVCGDGLMEGAEECDNGVANGPAGNCTPACTLPVCGDGFAHPTEGCDDGNAAEDDACHSDCTPASCGDGVVQQGVELCDDGNLSDTDGCTTMCTLASCGDGVLQPGELCDDGNASNADACLSTCVPASCGDGFVRSGIEQCDDANGSNTDGCLASCTLASCGDGFVYAGVEECDGAGDPTVYSCSEQCLDQQVWYQWSFFAGYLPNPMACSDFNTWRGALANDHTSIHIAGTYDMPGRTCTGPAATTLCNALHDGTSASVNCDGHSWHVGNNCVGAMEVTVDGTECNCANPGYALRPCVNLVDWGGVGTSTCYGASQEIYIECGFD